MTGAAVPGTQLCRQIVAWQAEQAATRSLISTGGASNCAGEAPDQPNDKQNRLRMMAERRQGFMITEGLNREGTRFSPS